MSNPCPLTSISARVCRSPSDRHDLWSHGLGTRLGHIRVKSDEELHRLTRKALCENHEETQCPLAFSLKHCVGGESWNLLNLPLKAAAPVQIRSGLRGTAEGRAVRRNLRFAGVPSLCDCCWGGVRRTPSRQWEHIRHANSSMARLKPVSSRTPSNAVRTCNKLPGVCMCTRVVEVIDLDRGLLVRIDRKLLAGLGGNEEYRTVRVPATAAKWSTRRRHCESVGISMGRAVTLLIDRELIAVFGDLNGDGRPVFEERARERLKIREVAIAARQREVDAEEERMRGWDELLRRWEDALEAREQRAALVSKCPPRDSTIRAKNGRNER